VPGRAAPAATWRRPKLPETPNPETCSHQVGPPPQGASKLTRGDQAASFCADRACRAGSAARPRAGDCKVPLISGIVWRILPGWRFTALRAMGDILHERSRKLGKATGPPGIAAQLSVVAGCVTTVSLIGRADSFGSDPAGLLDRARPPGACWRGNPGRLIQPCVKTVCSGRGGASVAGSL